MSLQDSKSRVEVEWLALLSIVCGFCSIFRKLVSQSRVRRFDLGVKGDEFNRLVASFLECAVDVIFGFPYARYTVFVVTETFLKVRSQFTEDDRIRRLFIDLRSEC